MVNAISTLEMTRDSWLDARKQGLGGSDVATVLGINRFKSPYALWLEKTGRETDPEIVNEKMEAGIRLEPVVAEWFAEKTGLKARRDNKIRIHPDHSFLIANIDRLIVDAEGEDGPGILEVKTTSGHYARTWEEVIPDHYYLQLQHYLSVTGYSWGYVAVLIDGSRLVYYRFDRNDEVIENMNGQLIDFWENHVMADIPPSLESLSDVKEKYPVSTPGESVTATTDILQDLLSYRTLKAQIKEMEANLEQFEASIKGYMGEAEILEGDIEDEQGHVQRGVLATWKSSKPSMRFDSKEFAKHQPEIYALYLKEAPGQRRFLLK